MPIEGIIEKIHIEIYYFIISNIYHTHLCTHTLYILALFTTEAQDNGVLVKGAHLASLSLEWCCNQHLRFNTMSLTFLYCYPNVVHFHTESRLEWPRDTRCNIAWFIRLGHKEKKYIRLLSCLLRSFTLEKASHTIMRTLKPSWGDVHTGWGAC